MHTRASSTASKLGSDCFNSSQSFLLNKWTGDKESLFTHEVVKNQVDCSYENMM